jgi:hypothetical protein
MINDASPSGILQLGVNFINIFSTNAEKLWRKSFQMLIMATAFGKNVPKYGARCKSCSLKHPLKFQKKCCRNRTAFFAPFSLRWHLCIFRQIG